MGTNIWFLDCILNLNGQKTIVNVSDNAPDQHNCYHIGMTQFMVDMGECATSAINVLKTSPSNF
jgi:hypothetical protein